MVLHSPNALIATKLFAPPVRFERVLTLLDETMRHRINTPPEISPTIVNLVWDAGFAMERRMMLSIRERAQGSLPPKFIEPAALFWSLGSNPPPPEETDEIPDVPVSHNCVNVNGLFNNHCHANHPNTPSSINEYACSFQHAHRYGNPVSNAHPYPNSYGDHYTDPYT